MDTNAQISIELLDHEDVLQDFSEDQFWDANCPGFCQVYKRWFKLLALVEV